ncbi:hypothetical protein FACS1894198_2350 [Clostridia bacterium]|nr:hypothetical protein FACS1894198_2350 [Clostridia bacterium]
MDEKMYLRKVKVEDSDILFTWVNDEVTRRNSFNSKIIDHEEHLRWLKNILEDGQKDFWLLCLGGGKVEQSIGQIRFEYDKDNVTISYSIAPEYRRRGFGKLIIELGESELVDEHRHLGISKITAKVKPDNIASCKIFNTLGYSRTNKGDLVLFEKMLS